MKRLCLHCKKEITWMQMAPNGRKIPVEPGPDVNGRLMLDEATGWLVKAFETKTPRVRYQSHLINCRSLAKGLHAAKSIQIGREESCDFEGCTFEGKHAHVHCFKCGQPGHFANVCEGEPEVKELDFG